MQWNSPFGPFLPSSTSIPDALVYLFSHITLSHSTFLLFSPGSYYLSNISFLLLLVPVHPFCHFHYSSFHLPWKSLPPATCSSSSSPPNLHFQIDASQLPGAGWRWYEQMKVGFTVLTEISNSSISARRQSKKPTAACLDAASKRKKAHICMFRCVIANTVVIPNLDANEHFQ